MSKKVRKDSMYEKQLKAVRKKAKRRARLITFGLCAFMLAALIMCYSLVLKPARQYEQATADMNGGKWQSAFEVYRKLGNYKDSRRMAAYSECMGLFAEGKISEASDAYLVLDGNTQLMVRSSLGSFTALAQDAIDAGKYDEAYMYYSLDTENPERDDAMYAISVYLDSKEMFGEKRYAEARSEITACLEQSHALSAPLQQLIDSSYGEEFDYYDSFTATDLAFAVQGMQSISDEYEPAHIYLRDLDSAYYGGVLSMKEGKYKDAIVQFEDIIAYSDSAEKIDECRVLLANEQAASGQMDQALSTVALVKDWTAYIDILPEDNSLTSLLAADNQDNSNNNA